MQKIRILHYTTHDEECGIAKYQAQFILGMEDVVDIENKVFKYSPNQTRQMSSTELNAVMDELSEELRAADILHIQHENSFYKHLELESAINMAHSQNKRVIVTIHTALDVEYKKAHFRAYNLRTGIDYARQLRAQKNFEKIHLNPLRKADLTIVHNEFTKKSLIKYGFNASSIKLIRIPVPDLVFDQTSTELKEHLNYKSGDVLICTVGFISRTKGIDQAVKALQYLPPNYKLAIIGGPHPRGNDETFLDELSDYIAHHNLKDRIYITGYVKDDATMNALIRETDICVYPYDVRYYAYVSSAALNSALANHKATIAFPATSFLELNDQDEVIKFCKSSNYYELAREIRTLNIDVQNKLAKQYAQEYAYGKEAIKFADIYRKLLIY